MKKKHKHTFEFIEKMDNFEVVKIAAKNGYTIKPRLFYYFFCKECLKFETKEIK